MSKFSKSLVLGSVLAATSVASGSVLAEVTANVGATSNYLWRGVTQSADLSAVSGGLDYSNESGIYVGTWTSSLASGQYELDLYAGYAGEAGDFGYDIGFIQYMYPIGEDVELDFTEVQASVSYGPATLYVAQMIGAEDSTLDKDATYMSISLGGDINKDFSYSLTVGSYTGDDVEAAFGDTYNHYAASASKGDFTFAIEKNNIDNTAMVDDDPRVTVSWGIEL